MHARLSLAAVAAVLCLGGNALADQLENTRTD
jgi:hypothetical protein